MALPEQPPRDVPRPVRVALSNDFEIALLGLAQMLARHPDRVRIVDLTTLPAVPHEADIILYDTFGRLPVDDHKLREMVERNSARVVVYSWEHYPRSRPAAAGPRATCRRASARTPWWRPSWPCTRGASPSSIRPATRSRR